VLRGAVLLTALPVVGFSTDRRRSPVAADPFTLGVASGDPAPDGVVIWTRLAPHPLADDGLGGMPSRTVDVEWEAAADERFTRVEQRGVATAAPDAAHSVHVELTGMRPGADYFYRFRTGGYLSPAGRTRTAPPPESMVASLTMCVASCSNYEQGWFTAYRRLAEEQPDLVVHLGDYQYEYAAGASGDVREHVGPEMVTLANYRQRFAQYKTDPDLQAAHAAAPWLAVFDDHELANNWADEVPEKPQPGFLGRRAAALQAYYENMPLRRSAMPHGVDMQLYRRAQWGSLATFHMLDTRQYRTDQTCGDEIRSDCIERILPFGSLTGDAQEQWLLDGFQRSRARWDVLGQQVFFSQVELMQGPGRGFNPDAWDGYAANRDRIVAGVMHSPVRNAVVLTGDVHSHWAAEVRQRFDDPASPVVATELVTTSISSGGDGSDTRDGIAAVLAENPHIRYFSNHRGYVRTRVTPDELRADFQVVPFVSRPGAPVQTGATFVVPDRAPALHLM
jgi:alkaline phosphatase D